MQLLVYARQQQEKVPELDAARSTPSPVRENSQTFQIRETRATERYVRIGASSLISLWLVPGSFARVNRHVPEGSEVDSAHEVGKRFRIIESRSFGEDHRLGPLCQRTSVAGRNDPLPKFQPGTKSAVRP